MDEPGGVRSRDYLGLIALVCSNSVLSGIFTSYMATLEKGSDIIFTTEVLGAKLYLSAFGTGMLLIGFVAGEVYLVFKVISVRKMAEGVVLFSVVLLSGMLVLIFGRTFAYSYFPVGGSFIQLVIGIGVFVSIYLSFLILIGEYSERVKNLLLLFFSGTTAAFFAVLIPTLGMLLLLVVLAVLDLILLASKRSGPETNVDSKLTLNTEEWGLGAGDLIYFALATDAVALAAGFAGWLASFLILLAGLRTATSIAGGRGTAVPGTLLAGLPAALPLLLVLIFPRA